uniref:E4 ORF5 n=1 Tax=Bat mastadenovirus TaxID=740971 RepID=A0A8G0RDQ8_9ADEN|nr:E4 ORF5 [Bat mastadenovirus]
MSLLPLPPPLFGADVEGHRYWLETALYEARQAIIFYATWSPSYRQLSCLIALLTSALHRLELVCLRERARARSSEYQLLLWRKLSWLHGKYERVRGNLIDLMLDGQLQAATRASTSEC